MAQTGRSDAVAQTERALLGSILLDNSLWPQTAGISVEDFSLDSHRRMFATMAAMFEDQRPVDVVTLHGELSRLNYLDSCGGEAYLSSLFEDGYVPEHMADYVRRVREAATERHIARQLESLSAAWMSGKAALRSQVQQLGALLDVKDQGEGWRALFHTYEETINAPAARFAIEGFLQEEGITLIGGLAGHGKTLMMLAMVRALLEGGNLFDHFPVSKPAEKVIYLIPEAALGPFSGRLKTFHLLEHVEKGRLLYRTLSAPGKLFLTDPRLLEAAGGADVFLDTAIRFMSGDENSAADQKLFAENLFRLQRAGARTITGAHHSPKGFSRDNFMSLENVLRGSGDIGAMLATCWGISQIDATSTRIFVQNVKARDFPPCEPFIIQGRPSIDQSGYFELTEPPGLAGDFCDNKKPEKPVGRPELSNKDHKAAEARRMKGQGSSLREIARTLGVSKSSVERLISSEE